MTIQIETRYNIGDVVYFLKDDKIKTGTIYKMEVTFEENKKSLYMFARDTQDNLSVMHEDKAFPSKEQLIQSL
jgi:hypothetical protein